jgi:hypothetical protein
MWSEGGLVDLQGVEGSHVCCCASDTSATCSSSLVLQSTCTAAKEKQYSHLFIPKQCITAEPAWWGVDVR